MSHFYLPKKYDDWIIYREDCRPSLSHVYHDNCINRPSGSGEDFSINREEVSCGYCDVYVPELVMAILKSVRKGKLGRVD